MMIDVTRVFTGIVLILSFAACFYLGVQSQPTEMGLIIVAGSLFSAFLNLDKFQSFKGAGFSAELKETVEKAYATKAELEEFIDEAERQIKRLKDDIENAKSEAIAMSLALS